VAVYQDAPPVSPDQWSPHRSVGRSSCRRSNTFPHRSSARARMAKVSRALQGCASREPSPAGPPGGWESRRGDLRVVRGVALRLLVPFFQGRLDDPMHPPKLLPAELVAAIPDLQLTRGQDLLQLHPPGTLGRKVLHQVRHLHSQGRGQAVQELHGGQPAVALQGLDVDAAYLDLVRKFCWVRSRARRRDLMRFPDSWGTAPFSVRMLPLKIQRKGFAAKGERRGSTKRVQAKRSAAPPGLTRWARRRRSRGGGLRGCLEGVEGLPARATSWR
jgi:hypothetical protein